MGKTWDGWESPASFQRWCLAWSREVFRVLKPGAHLLAFGGTRTVHRLTCGIEDAGFEIRDGIDWLYGSGFPKSLDVSKAIDKQRDDRSEVKRVSAFLKNACEAAGLTDRDLDREFGFSGRMAGQWLTQADWVLLPRWEQWEKLRALLGFGYEIDAEVWRLNGRKGTPGEAWQSAEVVGLDARWNEPSGVVNVGQGDRQRVERQIKSANSDEASRWQGFGTALKPAREPIVVARKPLTGTVAATVQAYGTGALNIDACRVEGRDRTDYGLANATRSQGAVFGAPSASADFDSSKGRWPTNVVLSHGCPERCVAGCPVGELGEAAQFFPVFRYEAKADSAQRPRVDGTAHPTVKPLDLMRWLVRLVTPPGGTVLEPFAGSGTTAEACVIEGFQCIAIEREAAYLPLITARLSKPLQPAFAFDFGGAA